MQLWYYVFYTINCKKFANLNFTKYITLLTLIDGFLYILLNVLSSLLRIPKSVGRKASAAQSTTGKIFVIYLSNPLHDIVSGS